MDVSEDPRGGESPPKRARQSALERAIAVLEFVGGQTEQVALAEISRGTGIDKSTAHRILQTFVDAGYVFKSPNRPTYGIGEHLVRLVGRSPYEQVLRHASDSPLSELRDATHESASVHVLMHGVRVCIAEAESDRPLRMTSGVGNVYPLDAGAASKVLTAFGRTVGGASGDAELAVEIRRAGFATSSSETTEGARAIAVPIHDGLDLLGALNLAGPSVRFDPERDPTILARIEASAASISTAFATLTRG